MTPETGSLIHASCVTLNDVGLLIIGSAGSGKSGLALQLMALGAGLIADDRVQIARENDTLIARCPPTISGKIEARQFGVLQVIPIGSTKLHMVVDLDQNPGSRLPDLKTTSLEGIDLPLIAGKEVPNLSQALYVFIRSGAPML